MHYDNLPPTSYVSEKNSFILQILFKQLYLINKTNNLRENTRQMSIRIFKRMENKIKMGKSVW
jgi:hypothetical protein